MTKYWRFSLVAMSFLTTLLVGCGDDSAQPADALQGVAGSNALGLIRDAGSEPDLNQIRARIAENVHTTCRFQQENPEAGTEMGKVTAFRETSRKTENFGDQAAAVLIEYEAEVEFTALCNYQNGNRAPGDTLAIYGTAEFANDGAAWSMLPISIWAR